MNAPVVKASWMAAISCLLAGTPVPAADALRYEVTKGHYLVQTNASGPVYMAMNSFGFAARVRPSANGAITAASVLPSSATPARTLAPVDGGADWHFEERFDAEFAMNGVYPTGDIFTPVSYTLLMEGAQDGSRAATLTFADLAFSGYPLAPFVTNFEAAQDIDSTLDFTLSWGATGNPLRDFVQVKITDTGGSLVFATPEPFSPGALTGFSGLMVLPADTLPPGVSLTGRLTFFRPAAVNTNSYAGALGVPFLLKETRFPLATRAAPSPPALSLPPAAPGEFRLRLTGDTGRIYQIQATEDFRTWTNLLTTNLVSGVLDFIEPPPLRPRRFYRGKAGQ
jgi:hypothetical protein